MAAARAVPHARLFAALLLLLLSQAVILEPREHAWALEHALAQAAECERVNAVYTRQDSADVRGGGGGTPAPLPPASNRSRPWSLHATTYDPNLPPCLTPDALLAALKLGSRVFLPGEGFGPDGRPGRSAFQPLGCGFAWLSPRRACALLARVSRLYFIGDSLTRHLASAFAALLSGDLEYGVLPSGQAPSVYDTCRCDGQFSEMLECRAGGEVEFDDNRQARLCGGGGGSPFALHYVNSDHTGHIAAFSSLDVCAPGGNTARPVYFFLEGGLHKGANATLAAEVLIRPFMAALLRSNQRCPSTRLLVQWGSLPAQGRWLDGRYPNQAENLAVDYNARTAQLVASEFGGITSMDWWNLTRHAATSDGLHALSDVNLIKAQYVLNWLNLVLPPD